ncbi:Conserved_hypothetical protein [Hexamita inflata]|uniref:Uncharacterized protein n=1 Tax=Hexamita inflata TaxID=28002 RepID=A0AA86RFL6_9EUKA|nr:Conserved hypothetical protein [Hexamita inflata]
MKQTCLRLETIGRVRTPNKTWTAIDYSGRTFQYSAFLPQIIRRTIVLLTLSSPVRNATRQALVRNSHMESKSRSEAVPIFVCFSRVDLCSQAFAESYNLKGVALLDAIKQIWILLTRTPAQINDLVFVHLYKRLCICTNDCTFIQTIVYLYKRLCIYTNDCIFIQTIVHLYKRLCICTNDCTFIQTIVYLYKRLCICTNDCVFVQTIVHLYKRLYICQPVDI